MVGVGGRALGARACLYKICSLRTCYSAPRMTLLRPTRVRSTHDGKTFTFVC